MKINWKKLLIAVAIPLAVGGLSAALTAGGYQQFQELRQPPLSPPAWLFPVVWTILYVLMGISSYRIWTSVTTYEKRKQALVVYGAQLFFNFVWSIIFFNLEEYFFALVWLVALWVLIYITYAQFKQIDKIAAWLLIPYLIWVAFAGYLNLGVAVLN
ncbi:MAG: tryptophan-rich sensory protein [Ruminococcaceae bacterium]|nr:tryptophan-rich sensory protein [Oscillospiraceae bacterium]